MVIAWGADLLWVFVGWRVTWRRFNCVILLVVWCLLLLCCGFCCCLLFGLVFSWFVLCLVNCLIVPV